MKTGAVVGKFWPPHSGHHFLIDTARKSVDALTVMVVSQDTQRPTGEQRGAWLRESFPDVTVIVIPDIYEDDSSEAWAEYTIEVLGETPDVVFTSEEYGERWAKIMGSKHVLVDIDRDTYPVSGTLVREDPIGNWEHIPQNVRSYYAKRVCVLGAESTGTTTLSEDLAKHYKTTWVPELGRTYTYGKVTADQQGATWTSQEFNFIAEQQNMLEDQLARYANKILICDTNSFATAVWHERYMGYWSTDVERTFSDHKQPDLYVLTDVDIPFVQDGIRDGQHIRDQMHNRFIKLFKNYKLPHIIVSGTNEQRINHSLEYIDQLLTK